MFNIINHFASIVNFTFPLIGISLKIMGICNALDVTMDYLLENEYHTPTSVAEKELFNVIKDIEPHKLETLLKIAKVL